eukprot:CAMPEP_0176339918 /NCGR_PEP_ID=MMETSP0126-20121128/1140_1 /TAXON_ID=141414 ORGANISM="Strombidinopsis acuminatum, Strain SPMC142" /NCGR_SAMPLE_ID=MMETSP0126 /ASSEMBLY_ACC=CAM_ASM_000229 /LENGTH=94 /DNA_ID=CAMNT_0017683779 /DNA_START=476 /DNA_END=760 /DNA_ORIENTATION=-
MKRGVSFLGTGSFKAEKHGAQTTNMSSALAQMNAAFNKERLGLKTDVTMSQKSGRSGANDLRRKEIPELRELLAKCQVEIESIIKQQRAITKTK